MSENTGYTPASWSADTSFDAARTYYKNKVTDRGYDTAVSSGKKAGDLVEARLTTKVLVPINVFSDQTGSMKNWPETIFAKLGYLDHEANYYFGDGNWAISFGAFGDAHNREKYPFQVRPYCIGADMKKHLDELVPEGNGGGNMVESGELPFVYANSNVDAPNAEHPILILITDEKCYEVVSADYAKQWAGVELKDRVTTKQVIEELRAKGWSIHVILKPYWNSSGDGDSETQDTRTVREFWERLLGSENIYSLPDPNRVVDVIFGIFAKETGKYAEFYKELKDRQLPDKDGAKKVAIVENALKKAHAAYLSGDLDTVGTADADVKALPAPSKSKLRTGGKVVTDTDSKSLLPDDDE
jgi:hypothetical protein